MVQSQVNNAKPLQIDYQYVILLLVGWLLPGIQLRYVNRRFQVLHLWQCASTVNIRVILSREIADMDLAESPRDETRSHKLACLSLRNQEYYVALYKMSKLGSLHPHHWVSHSFTRLFVSYTTVVYVPCHAASTSESIRYINSRQFCVNVPMYKPHAGICPLCKDTRAIEYFYLITLI